MKFDFEVIHISEESSALSRNLQKAAIVLAFIVVKQIFLYGFHFSQIQYYGLLAIVNVYVINQCKQWGLKAFGPMFGFWWLMWLSILFNWGQIPRFYQPEIRTLAFLFVILAVGPFFQNAVLFAFRRCLLQWINLGICAMMLLSFLGYLGHFLPKDHQGYYLGCTGHSMILGAISGFSGINCLHELLREGISKKRQKWFIALYGSCILTIYASASRTCLGSLVCASLFYLLLVNKGRSTKALKTVTVAVFMGMLIMPFTGDMTSAMDSKMTSSNELSGNYTEGDAIYSLDNLTASRRGKWHDRLNEISHAPLFGVGAHSFRIEWCPSEIGNTTGQIEPGNGWLYVFSSMGIFAFLLFCSLVIKPIRRLWKSALPGTDAALLFGQMVFFAIYMNAEAHITAAGDFTFFYCWLVIAICNHPDMSALNQRTLQLFPSKTSYGY